MLENILAHSSAQDVKKLLQREDIKKLQKCMKLEFEQETKKKWLYYKNYSTNKPTRQAKIVTQQFCKFWASADKMLNSKPRINYGVILPTQFQGQFLMVRQSVTA